VPSYQQKQPGKTSMNNANLINQDSEVTEYGTPQDIISRARKTMGYIDLDPASNETFNETVGAYNFYTKESDGLKQEWHGNIWLNHPFWPRRKSV